MPASVENECSSGAICKPQFSGNHGIIETRVVEENLSEYEIT